MITPERKNRVLHLYKVKHKSCGKIAKIERMSLRDVYRILKEDSGEKVSWSNKKPKDNSKNYAAMNTLFRKHVHPVQVSIDLNISLEVVLPQYKIFKIAMGLERVVRTCEKRGDSWLTVANETTDAMNELGLSPESTVEFLRYTLRMQKAGYSVQMLKEEGERIDKANWNQVVHMSEEKQEHERRMSELYKEKGIVDRTENAKIKPEKTKNTNQPISNKKKLTDEETLQRLLNSIEPLANEFNPYKTES